MSDTNKNQNYGEINDEQKFFVLEHLCWLRDNEKVDKEKLQEVIEDIRNIYRRQTNEKNIKEILEKKENE